MRFNRIWAMPSGNTFEIAPIGALVKSYLAESQVSVDPFARNKRWATHTNDINPDTSAEYHLEATDFLRLLIKHGVQADLLIFDPPYSPRQVADCYAAAGITPSQKDTQNGRWYAECRDLALKVLTEKAMVISCGWNSVGMGSSRGFVMDEVLMVYHGGAHNDTIVTVERRLPEDQHSLF